MTEQPPGQGRPDDWDRGGYVPGEQYHGEQYYGSDAGSQPGQGAGSAGWPAATPGSGNANPEGGGPSQAMPTTQLRRPVPPPGDSGWGDSAWGDPARRAAQQGGAQPGAAGQGAAGQGAAGQGAAQYRGAQPATPQPGGWQQGAPPAGAHQEGVFPQHIFQPGPAQQGLPRQGADAKGFLGALFDFSFTSFVTTRIIKVLYALIMVLAVLSALLFTIVMFRVSAGLGLATLIIGDPLFIIIVMAFWRLVLESFVVVFRIAEDVRAMRERSDR